jgi:calcium-translocating P-type ATPase
VASTGITVPTVTDPEQPLEQAWHAISADQTAAQLATSAEGLPPADVEARRRDHGPNAIEEDGGPGRFRLFLHQFASPLIYLLLLAVVVTLLLGEWVDAAVIGSVLLLNAVIGFGQEYRAERSVRALLQLTAPEARVVRQGVEEVIDARDLVPGDVVLLESGALVPADLRLFAVTSLEIDESLLTGESRPVRKGIDPVDAEVVAADRTGLAYLGATVVRGRARGYVVATGAATELGRIAERVREEGPTRTPLQRRMDRFANLLAVAVAAAAITAFAIGLVRGEPLSEMFLVAVALAVAVVPEGLPVVFTVALALGVRRMADHRAIVRRLAAVETLGSTTTIGSDKTGTLTENRMTVQRFWLPTTAGTGRELSLADAPRELRTAPVGSLHWTLLAGVLASEAQRYRTGEEVRSEGDPTEVALLAAADEAGVDPAQARRTHEVMLEVPFEPERQYSAAVATFEDGPVLLVKGAPERVLTMSSWLQGPHGPVPLEASAVHAAAARMAGRGLRVLAMAYRPLEQVPASPDELPTDGLVFCGLQAMLDPPRPGVREAIAGCHAAGIRVVMITGDHADTARAIARDLGLAGDLDTVLTGRELESMSDEQLRAAVGEVTVFARVDPEHKYRVVTALQATGETVAVTGDGVNDAPALKAADIGIAMGRSGTDVAREAADMVLTDDDFVSIFHAVEQGRVTFDNIRKATFFLVSTGAAAIVALLTALALGWPTPLLAVQLLWLNLVTNGVQDIALAFEPAEPGVLDRPPRDRREGMLTPALWRRVALSGLVMGTITLSLFWWALERTGSIEQARTVALTTLVVAQAYHVFNSRVLTRSVWRTNPLTNRFLLAAQLVALTVHVGALHLPATQFLLRVEPIDAASWIRIVLAGLAVIAVNELHKAWERRRHGTTDEPTGTSPDAAGTSPDAAGTTPDATGNTPDAAGTTPASTPASLSRSERP